MSAGPAGAVGVTVRPMTFDDVGPVDVLTARTFDHLFRGSGEPYKGPRDAADARRSRGRLAHLVLDGPGRCVVAEGPDGRVVGHALSALREGWWILSLLIVDPARHSAGVGRRLLDAVLPTPDTPGLIAASPDPRAIRLYTSAGFRPRPVLTSTGPMTRRPPRPPDVRDGGPHDLDLCDALDRHNRGAWRRPDLELLLAHDARMRVVDDEGFSLAIGPRLLTLSARSTDGAAMLLRDVLAAHEVGTQVEVGWITQAQGWALDELLAAGLAFTSWGALCVRSHPDHPELPRPTYLASGAYL